MGTAEIGSMTSRLCDHDEGLVAEQDSQSAHKMHVIFSYEWVLTLLVLHFQYIRTFEWWTFKKLYRGI